MELYYLQKNERNDKEMIVNLAAMRKIKWSKEENC